MASIGSHTPRPLKAVSDERAPVTTTSSPSSVFYRLLVIRAFNAYWLLTFFQPDEYFQALEPAWQRAFGDASAAWLTWEWRLQLRSSLHPALFTAVYWIADGFTRLIPSALVIHLRPSILIAAPKVLQVVSAAASDWYTWQLAVKLYGRSSTSSWFALFMTICSPFQWFCSTRTFSNSLETTLTIMALYYWPWELFSEREAVKENPKASVLSGPSSHSPSSSPALRPINSLRVSLILAAFAVTLRPTNLLLWLTILITTLVTARSKSSAINLTVLLELAREIALCGSLALTVSLLSDRLWFGEWTFPPYKWLYFNISRSLAVFYGRNAWHYYLSQGIPLLSIAALPFVIAALYRIPKVGSRAPDLALRTLAAAVYAMVTALSLISHKEVRFIYPLLPTLHILAAPYAAAFFTRPAPVPTSDASSPEKAPRPQLRRKGLLKAALALNISLTAYLSLGHQPAPLNVLAFLRREFERLHPAEAQALPPFSADQGHHGPQVELFALFLTPCHSTPWRSHLIHPALHARALTCEPPLHTNPDTPERASYRDEGDRFYDDPVGFLGRELWPPQENQSGGESMHPERIPRFIVGFEGIEPWLDEFFVRGQGAGLGVHLTRAWEGWNGLFNEDWRRRGKLVVWDTGVYGG
ncbi:glycosyltransferase family 22 protein [Sodiomyces alcalophilus JCM 7366]|uniref:glycosyltransferase family 22 protein n=1 Tax=Sodiomyces alcalophilus JCM 7366 TaxID=591952 RepID=UPI0039B6953A